MGQQQNKSQQEMAAIVDDSGRIQAQFGGPGATQDAKEFLRDSVAGGVRHLRGATVVTGDKAKEAMQNGRL